MPWKAFKEGDEYCVYKLTGEGGDKTGDSLGCHPTKSEADDQVAALYVNAGDDEERAMGLFRQFWNGLREILHPRQERAMSMPRLYEIVDSLLYDMEGWPWLMDVYTDDGILYALTTEEGKLYRYAISIVDEQVALGERVQVMESHPAVMGEERGRTVIRQQPDGRWRWFSVSATSVLNRVGEIDSRALFDSFVAHAGETGEYPVRMFYHQGQAFRTGQADYLARDGYCYVTSGLFDDTPLAQAEVAARRADPNYWGESIGYLPMEAPDFVEISRDIRIPVYNAGINREISTLPETQAANLFTVTKQEVYRMSMVGNAWEAFLKLWEDAGAEDPEEAARRWLEENADERNRAIEAEGLITRDGDGAEGDDPEPETSGEAEGDPEGEPEEVPTEVVLDDEAVDAIVGRMIASGEFVSLAEAVDAMRGELSQAINDVRSLRQRVDEVDAGMDKRLVRLERDDDDKRREWQADLPARSQTHVTYRPRERHAGDEEGDPQPAGGTLDDWEREKQEKGIGY